ncbi:MAG: DM13 domain-containing protein [Chloroflexi bacterium]|nr:DM13 domain-containing protein [Chloroflexota bacterium]
MTTQFLLDPARGEQYRRALLVGVLLTGVIAGLLVLSSQAAADFLREGPARLTGLEGSSLRIVLGVGTLVATVVAVAALWPRAGIANILGGAVAIGVGLFLIHGVMMPAAGLFAAAVGTEVATRIPRERLRRAGPRSQPIFWAIGGVGAVVALVAVVWLTVWLVQPFFDEGETLDEELGFAIAGVDDEEDEQSAAPAEDAAPEQQAAAQDAADGETAAAEQSAATVEEDAPDDSADDAAAQAEADGDESAQTSAAAQAEATEDTTEDAGEDTTDAADEPAAEEPAAEEPAAEESPAEEPAAEEPEEEAQPAERTGRLVSQGELMGADEFHTGSGDVLLVISPDGDVILRFQDYAVRNGPDLHVYLTPDPGGDVHVDGAISLGPVKATQGSVNYEVPPDVDPDSFRAAVIYCVPFRVVFATALLEGA